MKLRTLLLFPKLLLSVYLERITQKSFISQPICPKHFSNLSLSEEFCYRIENFMLAFRFIPINNSTISVYPPSKNLCVVIFLFQVDLLLIIIDGHRYPISKIDYKRFSIYGNRSIFTCPAANQNAEFFSIESILKV